MRDPRFTLIDQRDVRAGAAHVKANGSIEPTQIADEAAGNRTSCDSGTRQPSCEILDTWWSHDAAACVQQK